MSDTPPLVSVITPVYNCEKFVSQAIESILNQTYKDFEYIIVDDGSTDGTSSIIRRYANIDQRIKFIVNKKNRGPFVSYNIGINIAKGNYVAFQDSDDISNVNRLLKQKNFLDKNLQYDIVGSNLSIINELNLAIGKRNYCLDYEGIKKIAGRQAPFANPSVFIRSKVIKDADGFDSKLITTGDYDLWLRLLAKHKGANLPEHLVLYRISKLQSKSTKLKIQLKETICLIMKYGFTREYFHVYNILYLISLFILYPLPSCLIKKMFMLLNYEQQLPANTF